jgi:hypothetical protein
MYPLAPMEILTETLGFERILQLVEQGNLTDLVLNFMFKPLDHWRETRPTILGIRTMQVAKLRPSHKISTVWAEEIKKITKTAMAWIRKWFEQQQGGSKLAVRATLDDEIVEQNVNEDDELRRSEAGRKKDWSGSVDFGRRYWERPRIKGRYGEQTRNLGEHWTTVEELQGTEGSEFVANFLFNITRSPTIGKCMSIHEN